MPIIANNIVVGGVKSPTGEKKKEETKTVSFRDVKIQAIEKIKKAESEKTTEENSRYMEKEDGELIRHINTKSHYLKDMFGI
jgi:hypothetical protein